MPPPKKKKKFRAMPAGLSVEVIAKVPSLYVLPSTAVFFHGTYRGAQSVVLPDTYIHPASVTHP